MKQVNLNSLRVFACVAEHGNLQRAADALGLSRGAVSQRIRNLEVELGTVLLVRGARGVSLTPEGERCRAAMGEALAVLETAFRDIADAPDRVTLHLGSSTAAKWLMPRMAAFAERFPRVALVTEAHSERMPRSLGRSEIALWPGAALDGNLDHRCRALTEIRLVAVCSPDFLRPDWPMGVETLLTLPLLQDAHRRWEAMIEAAGADGRATILNFDRSALALDAAIGGHGVAIAPRYMIEGDVAAKRLVEVWVDPEPADQWLYVSWSRAHLDQARTGRIVDWIAEQFAEPVVRP